MGRPLPGYPVVLLDAEDNVSEAEGEICLRLDERPLGLTDGYADDDAKTSDAMRGGSIAPAISRRGMLKAT